LPPPSAAVGHSPSPVTAALRQASQTADGRAALAAATGSQLAALVPGLPTDFRTSYEAGMAAVAGLPLAAALDAMHGYNDMSTAFMAWLRTRDGATAVTAADVQTFFSQLTADRRTRRRGEEAGASAY